MAANVRKNIGEVFIACFSVARPRPLKKVRNSSERGSYGQSKPTQDPANQVK